MITITLRTENAAFEDGYTEVVRILTLLAKQMAYRGSIEHDRIYDINGNFVGELVVSEEA